MAQCKSYDVTIPVNAETENYMKVGQRLAEICSKFVFQRERTENGYDHYQVRLRSRTAIQLQYKSTKIQYLDGIPPNY